MKINVAIVDDNSNDTANLKKFLDMYTLQSINEFTSTIYNDINQLIYDYESGKRFHVLLLDVEMPYMNGIELASIIREKWDRSPYIVFISNYPEYMSQSFNVRAFNYLSKPIDEKKVFELCNSIINDLSFSRTLITFIKLDDCIEPIPSKDILYIQTVPQKSDYVCMHLIDHIIDCHGSLTYWYNELKDYGFLQCFRSILVNVNHIHYIDNTSIVLTSKERLPLSRRNKKIINDTYINHIISIRRQ